MTMIIIIKKLMIQVTLSLMVARGGGAAGVGT